MPCESDKPKITIYVRRDAASTQELINFLDRHLDMLNQYLNINIVKVTSHNVGTIKSRGITKTPTAVYGGRKIVSLEEIVRFLTPANHNEDNFGFGVANPEAMVQQYQEELMNEDDQEEEETLMVNRDIQRRMSAIQRKRPEMHGVEKKMFVEGGRKLKKPSVTKTQFGSDDEFRTASRVDNIEATPVQTYSSEEDGLLQLEEMRNHEADNSGRVLHPGKRICFHS